MSYNTVFYKLARDQILGMTVYFTLHAKHLYFPVNRSAYGSFLL